MRFDVCLCALRQRVPPLMSWLLNFFVQRYLPHEGIVLFALDTSGGVFAILGRDVPRNTRNTRCPLLGAFQNYLNSITFLSHGYVIFLNGSAKIGNAF